MALKIVADSELYQCWTGDGFGWCEYGTDDPATSREKIAREQLYKVPDKNRTPAEIAKEILSRPPGEDAERDPMAGVGDVPLDPEDQCTIIQWVTSPVECAKKATADAALRVGLIAAGSYVVYLIVKRGIEKS
jgi:hypothetical protein